MENEKPLWTVGLSGPEFLLDVPKHGNVWATFTDANHVHLASHFGERNGKGDLIYRGVHWTGIFDLDRDAGGTWRQDGGYRLKPRQADDWQKEMTDAGRNLVYTAFIGAVEAFVTAHPEVLKAATLAEAERAYESAARAANEAWEASTAAERKRRELFTALSLARADLNPAVTHRNA